MKEKIKSSPIYKTFATKLFNAINQDWEKEKLVIGICGESGSGKSVTGFFLKKEFEEKTINVAYLQMDDYFNLPPKTNHENRLKSFDNVGPHEVNLKKLEQHIHSFRKDESIKAVECDFEKNIFIKKNIDFEGQEVLIVEGTYVGEIKNLDVLVFIDRDYNQTLENRIERGRETFDPFIERVLEIEHNFIKNYKAQANIIIDPNYKIKTAHA